MSDRETTATAESMSSSTVVLKKLLTTPMRNVSVTVCAQAGGGVGSADHSDAPPDGTRDVQR